jgi:hypothetical protein
MGRYRFAGGSLYFSSSDGTDPRLNGRRYRFEAPWPVSRNVAVLTYLVLGGIVVSTFRRWLWTGLLRLKARAAHLLEPDFAAVPTERPESRPSPSGFAEFDGTPLLRWESRLIVTLTIGLAVTVMVQFLASPSLGSIMFEYALKSLPLYLDGSAGSVLDFNGAGDPRGRVVNSFFAWLNVRARREFLLRTTIHPALSVNWVLYPLTLILLNRAIRRMTRGPRYASIVTLLYAASPGMLDTLVDYHMPGKALVNFWFAGALFGAALLLPADNQARPATGGLVLGATTCLGLLSDETGAFIPIGICLLFGREILFQTPPRSRLLAVASVVTAIGAYGLVVLVIVPLCNAALGQAPLDLPTSILKGPYAAMFGIEPRAFGLFKYYDPLGLLHALVSAHFIPGRAVDVSWTSHLPYPTFWRWSMREQFALCAVLFVMAALGRCLPTAAKSRILRVAVTLLAYVVVQAMLLVALSGYVHESAYYAALGSAFVALLVGSLAAASDRGPAVRALSWVLVVYVMAVESLNMVATARRHPYLGDGPLTWQELREVRGRIARGEVAKELAAQPFPTRRSLYAFEVAAAFQSAHGRAIDLHPMEEPQRGLLRHLDVDRNGDPSITPVSSRWTKPTAEIADLARLATPIDGRFFHAGTVLGERGAWAYRWTFDGSGEVVQRAWRYGLMRLWSADGRVEQRGGEVCLAFATAPDTCIASLYQGDDWMVAFAVDGTPVTRFRWESQ